MVTRRVRSLLPQIERVGSYLRERLKDLSFGEVRGKGLMVGVDTGRDCSEIVRSALGRGLLINCTAGTVLRFLPPLIVKEEHVDMAVEILREVLETTA